MKPLLTLLLLSLSVWMARATTNTAASGSWLDVSNAVRISVSGDVVQVPAGTNHWFAPVTIQGIILRGSGTNQTVIIDDTSISGSPILFNMIPTNTSLTRICYLQIQNGLTNLQTGGPHRDLPTIYLTGTNSFRIDHVLFYHLNAKPIVTDTAAYGVVDHCFFEMYALNANAMEIQGNSFGDDSWTIPYTFGTSNATYVEDCHISSTYGFASIDGFRGARMVIRYNKFDGTFVFTHGSESGQRNRSVRSQEIYNNIFSQGSANNAAVTVHGGTAAIFNNTITNLNYAALLEDYRTTDNSPAFTPWFGASGQIAWDSNGPVVVSGPARASGADLVMTNVNWTPNQWYGYTVYSTNQNRHGIVIANTVNTMTLNGVINSGYPITFAIGDGVSVRLVYPQLDQPGRGSGTLLVGASPTPTNLSQEVQMIYCWSNTQVIPFTSTTVGGFGATAYPSIRNGRDWTNAFMPGYSPFTYPHPLVTLETNPPPPTVIVTNIVNITNTFNLTNTFNVTNTTSMTLYSTNYVTIVSNVPYGVSLNWMDPNNESSIARWTKWNNGTALRYSLFWTLQTNLDTGTNWTTTTNWVQFADSPPSAVKVKMAIVPPNTLVTMVITIKGGLKTHPIPPHLYTGYPGVTFTEQPDAP